MDSRYASRQCHKLLSLLFIALLYSSVSPLPAKPVDAKRSQLAHPRLFFDAADLTELRSRKDLRHKKIWQFISNQARSYTMPSAVFGPDAKTYSDNLLTLALVALVDDSLRNRDGVLLTDLLWAYFDTMRSYPEWHNTVPFDNDRAVSSYLMSLSLVYDWHYDDLGETRKMETANLLLDRAVYWAATSHFLPRPDHFNGDGSIKWKWRHYFIGNHAMMNYLGLASVTFLLFEESQAQPLLDQLEAIWTMLKTTLSSDGADSESATYHSWSKRHLMMWLHMRDRALGTNSLAETPWFNQSVLYDIYSSLPGGSDNYGGATNYGDAKVYRIRSLRAMAARLGTAGLENSPYAQWLASNLDENNYDFMDYIWYDPDFPQQPLNQLPNWHHFPERGLFHWRSSWKNNATYFSIKSGSYMGGHDQPDIGTFLLYKNGVPYIMDLGTSNCFKANEHNVILVNGSGQYGESAANRRGGEPVHPDHWGKLETAFAGSTYFNVLANPTAMYPAATDSILKSWKREVIGFSDDLFILRDQIEGYQDINVDHFLHAYATKAWDGDPLDVDKQYLPAAPYDQNPWFVHSPGIYRLEPRANAQKMILKDLSASSWETSIESNRYVAKKTPDGIVMPRSCKEAYMTTLGGELKRSNTGASMSSLLFLHFSNQYHAESLHTDEAETIRILKNDSEILKIVWPVNSLARDIEGLSVKGEMGGVRQGTSPAYFGRNITTMVDKTIGHRLVKASAEVTIFAQTESQDARYILISTADELANITCFSPEMPSMLYLNGQLYPDYSWNNQQLQLKNLPPGQNRIDLIYSLSGKQKHEFKESGDALLKYSVYPNPFNAKALIEYEVSAPAHVTITIFDITGKKVADIFDGFKAAGIHRVRFDAAKLASNPYLYKITAGNQVVTGKLLLIK